MINRVGLNTQPLKSDLHSVKNAPKHLSKVGFGSTDEDMEPPVNNRKFNIKNAGSQFWKGLVSPIVNMVSSPTNMAIGAVVGLGIRKLLQVTSKEITKDGIKVAGGSPLAPLFVAAGLAYGGSQIAIGTFNAVKNKKNPEKAEEAFYDIGQGAGAVGTTVFASPKLLKLGTETLTAEQTSLLSVSKGAEAGNPLAATSACLNPKNLKVFGNESFKRISDNLPALKEFTVQLTRGGLLGGGAATTAAEDTIREISTSIPDAPSGVNDISSYLNVDTKTTKEED